MTTIAEFRQGFSQDFGPRTLGHSQNPTVAFSDVPADSVLIGDTDALGDPIQSTDRVRAVLETFPSTGTLDVWTIAGEMQWSPTTQGDSDSFDYRLFVNGADAGTQTVKLNSLVGTSSTETANTINAQVGGIDVVVGTASETGLSTVVQSDKVATVTVATDAGTSNTLAVSQATGIDVVVGSSAEDETANSILAQQTGIITIIPAAETAFVHGISSVKNNVIDGFRQGFAQDFGPRIFGHSENPTVAYGDIPSGSVLENDTGPIGEPILATDRVRAILETFISSGTLDVWSIAGEVQWTPASAEDQDSFTYRLFVNGADAGTAEVKLSGIGAAFEATEANSITVERSLAIGIAGDTETSLAISFIQTFGVGTVTEIAISQPINLNKTLSIGVASESETAEIARIGITKAITTASETENSESVGKAKNKIVNSSLETGSALSLSAGIILNVSTAIEINTSIAVDKSIGIPINDTLDISTSQAIGVSKQVSVEPAFETSVSEAVAKDIARQVIAVNEIESSNIIVSNKQVSISSPFENQIANGINQPGIINVAVVGTFESDISGTIGVAKGKAIVSTEEVNTASEVRPAILVVISSALETDSSNISGTAKSLNPVQVLETEESEGISISKNVSVSETSETSISLEIRPSISVAIGSASSTELTQSISPNKKVNVTPASELSFSLSVTGETTKPLVPINEIDTASVIPIKKEVVINTAVSTENTSGVTLTKTLIIPTATTINISNSITAVRGKFISPAIETSSTGNAIFFRSVSLGIADENQLAPSTRVKKDKNVQTIAEAQQASIVTPTKVIQASSAVESSSARILPTSKTLPEPEETIPFSEGWVLSVKGPPGKTIQIHENSSEQLLNLLGIPSQTFAPGDINLSILQNLKYQRIFNTMEVVRSHIDSSTSRREAKAIQQMVNRYVTAIPTSEEIFNDKTIEVIGNNKFPRVPLNASFTITTNGKTVTVTTTSSAPSALVSEINSNLGTISEVEAFVKEGSRIGFRSTDGSSFRLENGSPKNLLYSIGIPAGNYQNKLNDLADSLRDEMLLRYVNSRRANSL